MPHVPDHPFCAILTSAGPRAGFIACAFEGAQRTLQLRPPTRDAHAPTHAGQRVLDALFERAGLRDTLYVHCDLSDPELQDPRWTLPLAVQTLVAARTQISGLAELLYLEDILELLTACQIIRPEFDAHRVHAALYGGFHAQISHDAKVVQFNTPKAAMIWLQIPYTLPKSQWNQLHKETIGFKKHQGQSERVTRLFLNALCHDEFAILHAFDALQPPDSLRAAIPGWLPAYHSVKNAQKTTTCALEGSGPDMLIFAPTEREAMHAATLAHQRLEAHSFHATLHAWSTTEETP